MIADQRRHDESILIDAAVCLGAIALAVAAGGALKSGKTTVLMSGAQAVEAMKKTAAVAKTYRPAQ